MQTKAIEDFIHKKSLFNDSGSNKERLKKKKTIFFVEGSLYIGTPEAIENDVTFHHV